MAPIRSPVLAAAFLLVAPILVNAKINLTPAEQRCLEDTGKLFEGNDALIAARHDYATSMDTEMTSQLTMTAKYPEEQLRNYEKLCRSNGGTLHTIKIDFFDCKLGNFDQDVELTLKNFANCLASVEECEYFDQENLLEEAWEELGLHCELEDEGPGDVPYDPRARDDDQPIIMDDDLAHQEEKAAAEGADDMDRAEKNSEYIPKEMQGKNKKKKSGGSRFFTFILTVGIVGGVGYVIYDRKFNSRRLPWGGVSTSRFQSRGGGLQNGFVSDYHMLSGEEEMNFGMGGGNHELQLSSNYNP
jgi:hypothetical protein